MNEKEIVYYIVNKGLATIDQIKGCSEEEIIQLEGLVGDRLPDKYRNFLLASGHQAGKLFQGTSIFFHDLKDLKREAENLLLENNESYTLPENSFVFSMHQGYEFKFFLLSDGDDPPIYQYVEGSGKPEVSWQSFRSFLIEEIEATAKAIQRFGPR
jgi:hypothetical protein